MGIFFPLYLEFEHVERQHCNQCIPESRLQPEYATFFALKIMENCYKLKQLWNHKKERKIVSLFLSLSAVTENLFSVWVWPLGCICVSFGDYTFLG